MEVIAYVSGYTKGNTTAGILLRHGGDYHLNILDLGNVTKNVAELIAIEYAILAVNRDIDQIIININTSNAYTYGMFQKNEDEWNNTPKKNTELIDNIRGLLNSCEDFTVKLCRSEKHISQLTELQKRKSALVSESA